MPTPSHHNACNIPNFERTTYFRTTIISRWDRHESPFSQVLFRVGPRNCGAISAHRDGARDLSASDWPIARHQKRVTIYDNAPLDVLTVYCWHMVG